MIDRFSLGSGGNIGGDCLGGLARVKCEPGLHAGGYRNPGQLNDGDVVVGGGWIE